MPMNGSHNFNNASYSSGIDDEHPSEERNHYHHQTRRKRHVSSMPVTSGGYGHYSSHSNSRLSSSSQDEDVSSNDSLPAYYPHSNGCKKMKISENRQSADMDNNQGETSELCSGPSNSNCRHILSTPGEEKKMPSTSCELVSRRNDLDFTPDSGIAPTVCGSSASSMQNQSGSSSNYLHNHQHHSYQQDGNNNTNGETAAKLFQQKVARIRRNYRNNFGDDSDSD